MKIDRKAISEGRIRTQKLSLMFRFASGKSGRLRLSPREAAYSHSPHARNSRKGEDYYKVICAVHLFIF